MNKVKGLSLAVVFTMFCSALAFAQGSDEKSQPAVEEKTQDKQADRARMGASVMQMMGSMQKQMVATTEGGVIVLAGNKLQKYDKDLNLVKEVTITTPVELKIDSGSIQDIMKSMKEKYGKKDKASNEGSQEAAKEVK